MRHVFRVIGPVCVFFCTTCANANQINVLGSASTYAVLAPTITNTGSTALSGNLGFLGSITGFPPGQLTNGTTYSGTGPASIAMFDATTGYNYLAGATSTASLTGQNLGAMTLTPGVYSFLSSAQLTGALTLDFQNLNNANLIFQIGSSLTIDTGATITIINRGVGDNVYYQVGSSATLGAWSTMQGVLLANTSITLGTGASVGCGSAIALSGAITLDNNSITRCPSTGNGIIHSLANTSVTPEPPSLVLLATGLLGMLGLFRRNWMPAVESSPPASLR